MRAAISRECLNVKLPYRDERARLMKAMLISLLGK